MIVAQYFKKLMHRFSQGLDWPTTFMLIFAQAGITYLLFALAGETTLTHHPLEFIYYNMVVVSTVGFGDFSPVTHVGKAIVAFWQIPSGLIVFASFIGKATQLFIDIARRNMNGNNDFSHFNDHILLLCWDKHSTEQIVQLILGDKKRKKRQILLCVTDDMKNPFPDNHDVSFAKLRTFSDTQELDRVALRNAKRIIVDGKSDDETLSIALSIATFANKNANISAYFFDETKAQLLKMHCPHIECSIDNSAKMMVRSMQDPGSSRVTEELLSTLEGATLYSLTLPTLEKTYRFGNVFNNFKARYNVTLLGYSEGDNGEDMHLNPESDAMLDTGYHLHYVANERLDAEEVNWALIGE